MSTSKSVKCKICGKTYVSKQALIDHIEKTHSSTIPEGWNAARYENFLRTGKTEGHCVYCKKPTDWNNATGKYNRMCGSEKCKKIARELANKNYIGLHGKPYSINDPEQQKKMVYGRKNSGKYIFESEDGKEYVAMYDSSYGKDFFEMIDTFLSWDGADIIAPSPHTYWYEYEGKKHFYIPDAYSTSLNLEIEIKDGGDNPNNHPKIQAVDKVKEQKKDAVMKSLKGQVNYIKICNKDYSGFFKMLSELKQKDVCQLPKWESRLESITEGYYLCETMDSVMEAKTKNNAGLPLSPEFLGRQHNLRNPILNYDSLLEYYRKKLFHENLNSVQWQQLYNELINVREYLKKVTNGKSDEDKRMNYEATKALNQIESFIAYMEDKNESYPVNESSNNNAIDIKSPNSERKSVEEATKVTNDIPIYIVSWSYSSLVGMGVKVVTRSEYNHTSIALTPNLEECYTFSRNPETFNSEKTNGFCKESLSYMVNRHGNPKIKVTAVYVSKEVYDKIKRCIDEYIKHQDDTKFDYTNFLYSFLKIPRWTLNDDKLNCSVFVDLILKKSGVDLTNGKKSNLVTPRDLSELKEYYGKTLVVYEGDASGYDFTGVNKIINDSYINTPYKEEDIMESLLFNQKDLYYNKDKFDSGEINLCFITGHSGSGKSTMGRNLQNDVIEHYELDDLHCIKDHFTMDNLKEYGDLIYSYFKGRGNKFYITYDELVSSNTPGTKYEDILYSDFVHYAMNYANSHKNKKFIIEGIWLFCSGENGRPYFKPSEFKDYAFFIKGTSMVISKYRAAKRDAGDTNNIGGRFRTFSKQFFMNKWSHYLVNEKSIKQFRDYFSKLMKEDSIMESIKSTLDVGYTKKGNIKLSTLRKIKLTKSTIDQIKNKSKLIKHLDIDNDDCFGFFDGDELVCYIATETKEDGTVWITALEVLEPYRGHGLGEQLLDFATRNLHATTLGVSKNNEVAIKMYEKYGFEISNDSRIEVNRGNKNNYLMYLHGKTNNIMESSYIEATKNDTIYYPVFVFLSYTGTNMAKLIKSFTHNPYAHSSLSFDTDLDHMVSFNRDGMVEENIFSGVYKKNASKIRYSLYVYMATADEYEAMKRFVEQLTTKRDKLKYNLLGLTNFIFGRGSEREDKFFCSEFVAATISAGNNKVIKTQPFMTSPYMFAKNKNFVFIKTGILKNYDPKVIDKLVAEKLEEGGFTNVTIK